MPRSGIDIYHISEPRERLRLLARAYMKEFQGNIKNNAKSLKAAESWANDYPEIWQEWKDNA